LQHPAQQLHILSKCAVTESEFLDLANRMHDRGVIAATEFSANFWQ